MKPVLVTQRVDVVPSYGERRDALDQRWAPFLAACGLLAVPVANDRAVALALAAATAPAGILLTGGNDLVAIGGNAPERDDTEDALLAYARERRLPLLGVCRGMQFLLHRFGAPLEVVEGHVAVRHSVTADGRPLVVNSYHRYAARALGPGLRALAVGEDGVVEAFRHADEPIAGLMWHPEREDPFLRRDIDLVRHFFTDGTIRIEP